jgi:uncharacterized RDD family membrane protein YckC
MSVRRRDLRRPPVITSPRDLPAEHGAEDDPRYPSPTKCRAALSFVLDLVAHLAIAYAVTVALLKSQLAGSAPRDGFVVVVGVAIVFVVVSIVDRVFVQWMFQATIGKMVTALRVIRSDTGGRGTFWLYVRDWLLGVFGILAAALP